MRTAAPLALVAVIGAVAYTSHLVDDRAAIMAFASTAPWLLICHPSRGPSLRAASIFLGMLYAIGLASLQWLIKISVGGWLIAPVFYVVLFIPMFAMARGLFAMWPRAPLSLLWPLAFVAGEWIRISTSPGEVPFGQLAQALVAYPRLAQSADIGGAWILSGLAASTGGLIASVVYPGLTGSRRGLPMLMREAAFPVVALALCLIYGEMQLRAVSFTPGPVVLLVQPNTPGWRDPTRARERTLDIIRMTETAVDQQPVEMVVWPENSLVLNAPDESDASRERLGRVRALAAKLGAPVVADGGSFTTTTARERHSAAVVFPSGKLERSDKQLLVPWSEYVPFRELLNRLRPGAGDSFERFVRARNPSLTPVEYGGDDPRLFELAEVPQTLFVVPICYEGLSSRTMNAMYRRALDHGARRLFVANVVNEILLGESVHRQTLAYSRLRAIEGRVTVLRATNDGISAVINPNGEVQAMLEDADNRGTLRATVVFDSRFGTPYARLGDFVPQVSLAAVASLLILGFVDQQRHSSYRTRHASVRI